MPGGPFRLLRDALRQLSLDADQQREELKGYDVAYELADDFDNAVLSLNREMETTGHRLNEDLILRLQVLNRTFDRPPDDEVWAEESLDEHPVWVEARQLARTWSLELPAVERSAI